MVINYYQCIAFSISALHILKPLYIIPEAVFRVSRTQCLSLTSASLEDMNLSTTCFRYSKLISRVSSRSELLMTVVCEAIAPGPVDDVEPGAGTGAVARAGVSELGFSVGRSCRPSGSFSLLSVSVSGFSFCCTNKRARIRGQWGEFLVCCCVVVFWPQTHGIKLWASETLHWPEEANFTRCKSTFTKR